VALAPQEASATPIVEGSRARYAQAWPGVDASYQAMPSAVKETLELKDATAARTLHFAVTAASGLTASRRPGGAVVLRDRDQRVVFTLSAPVMRDAAGIDGPIATSLAKTATGWDVSLSPSRSWLSASARRWPVRIDPTVYPGADPDCLVSDETGYADTTFCGWDDLEAG
jgi:hypothetical protein